MVALSCISGRQHLRVQRGWSSLVLLGLGLALVGCGSGEERGVQAQSRKSGAIPEDAAKAPTAGTFTPRAIGPSVRILEPADAATLSGRDVQVTVAVENFNIVGKQGQAAVPGEGHVHFYLDVGRLPTAPGQHAAPPGRRGYYSSSNTTYTWKGLQPGEHKLAVQLVTNDHRALDRPVTAQVTVRVT